MSVAAERSSRESIRYVPGVRSSPGYTVGVHEASGARLCRDTRGGARPGGSVRAPRSRRRVGVRACWPRAETRRWPSLTLLWIAVFGVVFGFGLLGERMAEPASVDTRVVIVSPGQTLHELAERVAPDGQVGEVVRRIVRLNALPAPVVRAGMSVVVPRR